MVSNLSVTFSQFNLLGVTGNNVMITAHTEWMEAKGIPTGTPPLEGLVLGELLDLFAQANNT